VFSGEMFVKTYRDALAKLEGSNKTLIIYVEILVKFLDEKIFCTS